MQSKASKPLVGPGPRDPWKVVKWSALAVMVAGLGIWYGPRYVHQLKINAAHVEPHFHPTSSSANVIAQINSVNQQYQTWVDQQVHSVIPEIPATGPNAATLTPAILNSPGILKKWPGPKVPTSLKGIKIPSNTPANGAIVGLNASALNHYTSEAQKIWPKMTKAQVKGALTTAARYIATGYGNSTAASLQFSDALMQGGARDYNLLNRGWGQGRKFTQSAAKGGMLPTRSVLYRSWIVFPSPGTSSSPTITASPWTITQPSGHLRYNDVMINNVTFETIGSGMVHGKLTVGLYIVHTAQITMALISSGKKSQWFVAGVNSAPAFYTPTTVYWTRP